VSVKRKEGLGDKIMRSALSLGSPWYINKITRDRYYFNMNFRAPRGFLSFSDKLLSFGRDHADYVIVEPNIKGTVSARNKDWGWARWQQLIDAIELPWAQFDYGEQILQEVVPIKTKSFMHGAAVLNYSKGLVTTDGGLHHAAAALGLKAVVIFGGYSPPEILGYNDHINLSVDEPDCLGMKAPCEACGIAMKMITVNQVVAACQIWK
jgi:ADP-heptose:LPS heptosyltransferase